MEHGTVPTEGGSSTNTPRGYPSLRGIEAGETYRMSNVDMTVRIRGISRRQGLVSVEIPGEGLKRLPLSFCKTLEPIDAEGGL